jgi:hypothetical protein
MAAPGPERLIVARLRAVPFGLLRPSAVVDFALFFGCGKPAARLLIDSEGGVDALRDWCREAGFDFAADEDGFACVAREPGAAWRVLETDRRAEPHEVELGSALGYPACCCQRVASVGESGIDAYAAEVAGWHFRGDYRRINPAGFSVGQALISHLPCSPGCGASLEIANAARQFVLAHAAEPALLGLSRSPVVLE